MNHTAQSKRTLAEVCPLQILVVDDSPTHQATMEDFLERLGYSATFVSNGAEAVNEYKNCYYNLVLMDIEMPDIDGFEATAGIRYWESLTQESHANAYIVAVTIVTSFSERAQENLETRFNDHLPKPFDMKGLSQILLNAFKHKTELQRQVKANV